MSKRKFTNRLNDLPNKEWLKFQKSWFIHNPPARKKGVRRHPAKFPETLVEEFIRFFTKEQKVVFDPMVGTGSTIIAALRSNRHGYGFELNPEYSAIARQVVAEEIQVLGDLGTKIDAKVITADARDMDTLIPQHGIPKIDYVITSPPYWNMLHARGAGTQKKRREDDTLDVVYSSHPDDLGNISDYDQFLTQLVSIYKKIKPHLKNLAYLTIIVKNIKKRGVIYPLAWDLARKLKDTYVLKDEKIWCQDNIRLAPYGMGNSWVSNTVHHYCLQFRNENP
jgi:DNA modification methylase